MMPEQITPADLHRLRETLNGLHGDDQQRIAEQGVRVVVLLLKKNVDYGSSAFEPPVLAPGLTARESIQCRMSDKIARLRRQLSGQAMQISESPVETMTDLVGYGLLWLAWQPDSGGEDQ